MKRILLITAMALVPWVAGAFPPAPHHEVYGTVRDERGNPLEAGATVTFSGSSGDVLEGVVDPLLGAGVNYSMKVPMDAGTLSQLYQRSALRPSMLFTVRVTVGGVEHVPIEVKGNPPAIGEAAGRTRMDLTLGVDVDGDGLPDSWEEAVVAAVEGIDGIGEVTKDGDSDGDGVSNWVEYLAGTYAFDRRAVFRLEIVSVDAGVARLRFLAVTGRDYRISEAGVVGGGGDVKFALTADEGAEVVEGYRAGSTRYRDVYVAVGEDRERLFRLHVE